MEMTPLNLSLLSRLLDISEIGLPLHATFTMNNIYSGGHVFTARTRVHGLGPYMSLLHGRSQGDHGDGSLSYKGDPSNFSLVYVTQMRLTSVQQRLLTYLLTCLLIPKKNEINQPWYFGNSTSEFGHEDD